MDYREHYRKVQALQARIEELEGIIHDTVARGQARPEELEGIIHDLETENRHRLETIESLVSANTQPKEGN